MSHSSGLVRFSDGEIWHFEYNGTSDFCISHIYKTAQEVSDNWRNHEWVNCSCGKSEQVEVYSFYGRGFMMDGTACRKCCSLNVDMDDCGMDDALSVWVKEYLNESGEE